MSSIFDSQITPIDTVRAYFTHDFRGFFELSDLYADSEGVIRNRRWGTAHPHEFKLGLARGYKLARVRHDRQCANIRRAISFGNPLFVATGRDASVWEEIVGRPVIAVDDPAPADWSGTNCLWDQALAGYRFSARGTIVGYGRKLQRRLYKARDDIVVLWDRRVAV